MTRSLVGKALLTTALTSLAASMAMAQAADPLTTADEVGPLPSNNSTRVNAVSGDGSTVVGVAQGAPDYGSRAIIWTSDGGTQDLGKPDGANLPAHALDVSQDGSAVAYFYHTRSYRLKDGVWTSLGTLAGGTTSAYGINADGTVLVGVSTNSAGRWEAFRWKEGVGITGIGALAAGSAESYAFDVSTDGSVVVGYSGTTEFGGATHAFRWVEGEGMTDLGTLGGIASYAYGVNADGSVVVGYAYPSSGSHRAFRWTEAGGMADLGVLSGGSSSTARDVNADGSVVVGESHSERGTQAFRWVDGEGMTGLGFLEGGNYSRATGVSDDGSIVVGTAYNGDNAERGFVWGGGPMLDHENTMMQIATNAHEQANAMSDLGQSADAILGQELIPGAVQGGPVGGWLSSKGAAARAPYALRLSLGVGRGDDTGVSVAGISGALALEGSNAVVGGYLGLANEDGDLAGLDVDGTLAATGLWLRGNPGGAGLTWKIGAAYMGGDATILRDASLSSTEAGFGDSRLSATSLQAEIGYGMDRGSMRITPFAGLRHTKVKRDGYTETNAVSFPLTYDDYEQSWTVARFGVHADMAAGARGQLRLSAGLETDLSRSNDPVTGTSSLPGMTTFAVPAAAVAHDTRGFVQGQYVHGLGNGSAIDLSLGIAQSAYGGGALVTAAIGWQMHF